MTFQTKTIMRKDIVIKCYFIDNIIKVNKI